MSLTEHTTPAAENTRVTEGQNTQNHFAETLGNKQDALSAAKEAYGLLQKAFGDDQKAIAIEVNRRLQQFGNSEKQVGILLKVLELNGEETPPNEEHKDIWKELDIPQLNSFIVGAIVSAVEIGNLTGIIVRVVLPQLREVNPALFNHLGNLDAAAILIMGDLALDQLAEKDSINEIMDSLKIREFYPYIISAIFFAVNYISESQLKGYIVDKPDFYMGLFGLLAGNVAYQIHKQLRAGLTKMKGRKPTLMELGDTSLFIGPKILKRKMRRIFQGDKEF